jgi:hypothetical protein
LLFNSSLESLIDPKTKNRLTQNRFFLLSILVWVEEFKKSEFDKNEKNLIEKLKNKNIIFDYFCGLISDYQVRKKDVSKNSCEAFT